MIAIIDYGLGNHHAFANMLKDIGAPYHITGDAADIERASHLILPGVGHFDHAMSRLASSGLLPVLHQQVQGQAVPVLGICVGMQMLADRSEEGELPGLGWIAGDVVRFPDHIGNRPLPIPHMGWNDVAPVAGAPLFTSVPANPRFYFLHSFHYRCANPEDAMAESEYGLRFPSAVRRGNVFGVQFHPEKSHGWGRALLADFAAWNG